VPESSGARPLFSLPSPEQLLKLALRSARVHRTLRPISRRRGGSRGVRGTCASRNRDSGEREHGESYKFVFHLPL